MNILAIDTTNIDARIVAKINNENKHYEMSAQEKHSEHLLINIDNILNQNNFNLSDFDVFGVVLGPGSFTGIRIGIATIKAFALGLNKSNLIGKNLFEVVKNYIINGVLLINCTKTSVYYGIIKDSKVENTGVCDISEILDYINDNNNIYVIRNSNNWYETLNLNFTVIENYNEILLNEFVNCVNQKDYISSDELKPFYIQVSQAERNLDKGKLNENN